MSNNKKFRLSADQIANLVPGMGGCIATDKITVEGEPVKYMYHGEPINELDSGWQFLSGLEDQDYLDDAGNSGIYDVNTIANYDRAIIPYLKLPVGTELERLDGTNLFEIIPG